MTDQASNDQGIADLRPLVRAKEQRAWYWYDWANSRLRHHDGRGAVRAVPHLRRRGQRLRAGHRRRLRLQRADLQILGLDISAGSLVFYLVTAATILSALVLPVVGAIADRSVGQDHADGAASRGPAARWRC